MIEEPSSMREATLLLHLIGLGLLMTTMVGGILLHRQYRSTQDLRAKALILKTARPFGLLSPIAMAVMLITGIGNMHALGVGLLDLGWLSAKITLFAVAVVAGTVLGVVAGKRGKLVHTMSLGDGGPDAEARLASLDRTLVIGQVLMPLLVVGILYLTVIGQLGAQ
jgi:hypothetical protein